MNNFVVSVNFFVFYVSKVIIDKCIFHIKFEYFIVFVSIIINPKWLCPSALFKNDIVDSKCTYLWRRHWTGARIKIHCCLPFYLFLLREKQRQRARSWMKEQEWISKKRTVKRRRRDAAKKIDKYAYICTRRHRTFLSISIYEIHSVSHYFLSVCRLLSSRLNAFIWEKLGWPFEVHIFKSYVEHLHWLSIRSSIDEYKNKRNVSVLDS